MGVSWTRGEGPEDIDFRVKPAIFSVDNQQREGSKISSGDPRTDSLDTSFSSPLVSPFFSTLSRGPRRDFQKEGEGEEEKKRKERKTTSRGVKRRALDVRGRDEGMRS